MMETFQGLRITLPSPILIWSESEGNWLSFFNCHSSIRPAKSMPSKEGSRVDWREESWGIIVLEAGELNGVIDMLLLMSFRHWGESERENFSYSFLKNDKPFHFTLKICRELLARARCKLVHDSEKTEKRPSPTRLCCQDGEYFCNKKIFCLKLL